MAHLSDADIRRAIDEPLALSARQRGHLHACDRCTAIWNETRENARFAASMFAVSSPVVDTHRAFRAVHSRLATEAAPARSWSLRLGAWLQQYRRRVTIPAGGAALAAVAVASLAFTPAGSYAQSFIDIFQPKDLATVSVTSADLRTMLQLRHYRTAHPPADVAPPH